MLLKRLLLAALLLQPAFAQQQLIGQPFGPPGEDSRVEVVALFSKASRGGFLPVRVTIANKSKNPGKARLHFVSSASDGAGDGQIASDFTISGDQEKTSVQDVLVPLFNPGAGGRGASIASVEVTMGGSFGSGRGNLGVDDSGAEPSILFSDALYTKNASALDAEASSHSGGSGGFSGREEFAGKFDPKMLPDDWRAFSGFDAVAMTDADWTGMSPGARNALLQWNRMGGRLVIYSSATTDLKSLGIKTEDSNPASGTRSLGSVLIQSMPASMLLEAGPTVNLFYGTPKDKVPKAFHESMNQDYDSVWPLQSVFGNKDFQYGIFVVVLIVFAILVGPVNLFVFAKSGRRHRLFITTPLIALGASLILILMIFFQDGLGGRGQRLVLMEVRADNGENAAYIHQEQISRTGVLLGSDFNLEGQAMITPVRLASSKWARFTNNTEKSWRFEEQAEQGNLKISGDWFQSRSEQGQALQAVIPTRGRIEARSEAGPPAFLSTFDFPITTLWYIDSSGAAWQADNIVPGKVFTCTAMGGTGVPAGIASETAALSAKLRDKSKDLFARKGYFVAVTDAAPGLDSFRHISWKTTHTIITGPIAKP